MVEEPAFATPVERMMRTLVRTLLLGMLEPWTAEELQWAVNHNVMLVALLRKLPREFTQFQEVGRKVPDWARYFTVAYTVQWLLDNRKDFAVVLGNPRGHQWLKDNIDALRTAVWEDPTGILSPTDNEYVQNLADQFIAEHGGGT